jgi:hypothetical protein
MQRSCPKEEEETKFHLMFLVGFLHFTRFLINNFLHTLKTSDKFCKEDFDKPFLNAPIFKGRFSPSTQILFKSNSFKILIWTNVALILISLFDHIKNPFFKGIKIFVEPH